MGDAETIVVPRVIACKIRSEAKRLDMCVDEYLVELLSQSLDPKERAIEYVEAARELLEEACNELERGSIRQAAGKSLRRCRASS